MIGRERMRMVSFPPRITLSATALLPKSFKIPALNSVRYPTPTIFKRILISPFSIPVSDAIVDMIFTGYENENNDHARDGDGKGQLGLRTFQKDRRNRRDKGDADDFKDLHIRISFFFVFPYLRSFAARRLS